MHLKALLLIGQTGSGKTPLGETCELNGLWGKKCAHFDFGELLRQVAANLEKPPFLTSEDMDIITKSLETGTLLENETFYIARNIITAFVGIRKMGPDDILLLNGLPRHLGQAEDVDSFLDIKKVIHLKCNPEVIYERIRLDSGGDREGRTDDSMEEIESKLELFNERTLPLLDHYRSKGVSINQLEVSVETSAEDLYLHIDDLPKF